MTVERLAYSPAEVADALGVSLSSVYRLLAAGRLKSVRVQPQLVRVPVWAVAEYLEGAS